MAIAISQAQIYAELQQQKQTLEQRVIERTQALQDIMLAAQSADRAKSEFLASMSHELRTPLTCIIGMSATLQRWSADILNPRQQSFLQTIHDSGEHLLLFNLLGNAIKFTPTGGRVTLRTFSEEGVVVFQIKDTGIGIPELLLPSPISKVSAA